MGLINTHRCFQTLSPALPPPRPRLRVYSWERVELRISGLVEKFEKREPYWKQWQMSACTLSTGTPERWRAGLHPLEGDGKTPGNLRSWRGKDLKTWRLFLNETTSPEHAAVSYPFPQLIGHSLGSRASNKLLNQKTSKNHGKCWESLRIERLRPEKIKRKNDLDKPKYAGGFKKTPPPYR